MAEQFQFALDKVKFEDINQEVKDYFKSIGYDYLNGSNFDLLTRFLAWFKMNYNFEMSNVANNLFISSSNNVEVVYTLANEMGYEIRRCIPSRVKVKLSYNLSNNISNSFLANNIIVKGKNNNLKYYAENIEFRLNSSTNKYEADFLAFQKEYKSYTYYATGEKNQKIVLPDTNITNDEISVIDETNGLEWSKIDNFSEIPQSDSKIYFIRMNTKNETEITFGDGYIGSIPQFNEKYKLEYYTCDSLEANNETDFEITKIIIFSDNSELSNISNYTLTNNTSYGFVDVEGIEEIKVNATKYFSNIGNNIVKNDFKNVLQIENDYFAYSNVSVEKADNAILSEYFFMLVPSNYKDNTYIVDGESLPYKSIINLTLENNEDVDLNKYYRDWVYLEKASPSYIHFDIKPYIKLKEYKDFNIVSKRLQVNLQNYIDSYLFGFDKDVYSSDLIKILNSDDSILDSKIDLTFRLLISKENILDKYKLNIYNNFLKTDTTHLNDLKNYSNYPYDFLLDVDKTVYCELPSSKFNFKRNFTTSNIKVNRDTENIFTLRYYNDRGQIEYGTLDVNKSDLNRVRINNAEIVVKQFEKTENETYTAYYFSGDDSVIENSETTNLKRFNENFPKFTPDSTELANIKNYLYFNHNGINYLFGYTIDVNVSQNNTITVFKEITLKNYLNVLFESIGYLYDATRNVVDFTYSTEKIDTINYQKITGLMGKYTTTQDNSNTNVAIKTTSKKELFVYNLNSKTLTINETDIKTNFQISQEGKYIYVYDISNTDVGEYIFKFEIDTDKLTLLETKEYTATLEEYYENTLKNFKVEIFDDSQNVAYVYIFDIYDNINVATVDIGGGKINFNKETYYFLDYPELEPKQIALSDVLNEVMKSEEIYNMNLISKNDILKVDNVLESAEGKDSIFNLPNLTSFIKI